MVKLSNEQKDEIIVLKLEGKKANEIMSKYNISRPYIYKLLKDHNIECQSEVNSNIDITEIAPENDIFESLNENNIQNDTNNYTPGQADLPEPVYFPEPTQQKLPNVNLSVGNSVSNDKLNSLRMFMDDEPKVPKTQKIQTVKVEKDLTLSEEYPEIQNTMNVIKRYLDCYYNTGKLDDIVGSDKRTFAMRLNELDLYQLKVLLSNIQFKLSSSNTSKLFESGFYLMASQVESTVCYFDYDVSGLTQALRHNHEVGECLKELSCKFDVTKYVSPESRLIMAVAMTGYSIYNQNSLKVKFDNFLRQPVDERIKENYKNL